MFGNFNLNAGLSQLQDLGGKFQKIREDLEQNIESSLRSGTTPGGDTGVAGVSASADGSVSFAGILARATTVLRSLVSAGTACQRYGILGDSRDL